MSNRRARLRRTNKISASSIALRVGAVLLSALLLFSVVGVASAYALVRSWLKDLPDYKSKTAFEVAQPTKIYSADGKLLAKLYLENREVVPISQIATSLTDGVVSIEDERFYDHGGIDPIGLVRATLKTASGTRQGASTITQQYVRNTLLLDERTQMTATRKVREAYLAMELEKRYSKTRILEMYLNTVYFGEGAYGAEAAAQTYFARSAKDLTLAQGALLAGLLQSPSRLDPYNNPEGATARRSEVLGRMLYNSKINLAQYEQAKAEPLALMRIKEPVDGVYSAPYFVAHVKKALQQQFTPAVVFKGGLTVYTTLDTKIQGYAEKASRETFTNSKDPEVALVSIDPRTGYVKALVGGRDYAKNKFNLATQGYRQPGSSFKTFVLATAIEQGMPPWYDIDSSSPAEIPAKPNPWIVDNSEGSGSGMMSLESATHSSVNTVFARLAYGIGIKNVVKMAKRMGIETKLPNYPSIALGASNVTPIEMASAYGTLATGGTHFPTTVVTKVIDRDGQTVFESAPQGTQVLKPDVARAITDILSGVITQGTGTRANIGRPAAGKTGTSQLNRDLWFVGYTPQLVTAVWVGYPTERTVEIDGSLGYGGTVAAPIWASFMERALAGRNASDFPKASEPTWDTAQFDIPKGDSSSTTQDVVGDSLSSAQDALGGKVSVTYDWSSKRKGTVIDQSTRNGRTTLTVSKGPKPSSGSGGSSGTGSGNSDSGGSVPTSGTP
ncbi:MAG: PBP1A family penicillin-binding protein [Coriobacteriia bacterium]